MKLIFIITFLLLADTSFSQESNPVTSSFFYYHMADSFSQKKDSIKASEYLLKIDPYYFLSSGQTPDAMDILFTHALHVTWEAKEKYKKIFKDAYDAPRSDAYKTFEQYAREDKAIRHRIDKCYDSTGQLFMDTGPCSGYEKQMAQQDKVHFKYLWDHVHAHGWPAIADGSNICICSGTARPC